MRQSHEHLPPGNNCLHELPNWVERGELFAQYNQSGGPRHTIEQQTCQLKIPTLGVGDQEVAERLHARDVL